MALDLDLHEDMSYSEANWAEFVDEETLKKMGVDLCDDIKLDAESRADWLDETNVWLDMASQVIEQKNTPWEGASNVKFPLLTTAALQFHARAHQELLKGDQVVRGKVIGGDADGDKAKRGVRVAGAMSNQLMYQMDDWQDDTDRLLFILPLVGTVFRKTYWSNLVGRPASELVLPTDLIVNYFATDWERCRKTHAFLKTRNEIVEQKRLDNYLDVDLPKEATPPSSESEKDSPESPSDSSKVYSPKDVPFSMYETHAWWDLDEDGYDEPYIVTVLHETQEIVRIVPRFDTTRITKGWDEKEQPTVIRIEPYEYIVSYKFLPDIDSSIYGTGFGKLIGPTGAAVDSIINQLIDAGTLATMPSGFYGRGVRIARGGKIKLKPGEWRKVNTPSGQDLASNFFALPAKEPSSVLFQLLGLLIQAGERMGSVTEGSSGQNPGQNTSRGMNSDVMEQGMQVFLGIYKRVYRSLTREYRNLQLLNYMYLGDDAYNELIDDEEAPPPNAPGPEGAPPGGPQGGPPQPQQPPPPPKPPASVRYDFDPAGLDIIPEADPNLDNSMRRKARANQLIEARNAGLPLNDKLITKMWLESIEEPDADKLIDNSPPPPSKDELQHKVQMKQLELNEQELRMTWMLRKHEPMADMAKAMKAYAEAAALGNEEAMQQMDLMIKQVEAQSKQVMEDQKHWNSMMLGDKKIEVEDAKRKSHEARTDATIKKSNEQPKAPAK